MPRGLRVLVQLSAIQPRSMAILEVQRSDECRIVKGIGATGIVTRSALRSFSLGPNVNVAHRGLEISGEADPAGPDGNAPSQRIGRRGLELRPYRPGR
jgi:hypothetical protein